MTVVPVTGGNGLHGIVMVVRGSVGRARNLAGPFVDSRFYFRPTSSLLKSKVAADQPGYQLG
jgi:hypothetical protein